MKKILFALCGVLCLCGCAVAGSGEAVTIREELKNNIEMRLIAKNLLGDLYFLKIEKAINNFIRKIGKVVIKVKQDKIKLGWRN